MSIYAYMRLSDMMFPLFEGDVRLAHPEIPESATGDNFPCPSTFVPVINTPAPEYDQTTHKMLCQSAELVNGVWQTKWEAIPRDFVEEARIAQEIKQMQARFGGSAAPNLDAAGSAPNVIG
jgi:hypothetical protein